VKKGLLFYNLLPVNCLVAAGLLLTAYYGSKAVSTIAEQRPVADRKTVVIDAGHGGMDGGATSYTGVLESQFNLEISLKLNDLMHLLGIRTRLIRDTDQSVHTSGETIAQKKVSDLKERVRIVNETDNSLLVSIHQNQFPDSRYSGAQIFYAPTGGSKALASLLQSSFVQHLNPGSNRQIKKADGIYLMQRINCTGVLIECGFLSNPQEEYLLRSDEYQRKICCVIACAVSTHLFDT